MRAWNAGPPLLTWINMNPNISNYIPSEVYRQVSNISRTKSQHLKDSRAVLWLSLPNPLKVDVKSKMKM